MSHFLFQENTPNSVKPEPKVSPEKIREFTCLKTPKKKYEPLSVVVIPVLKKAPLKFRGPAQKYIYPWNTNVQVKNCCFYLGLNTAA